MQIRLDLASFPPPLLLIYKFPTPSALHPLCFFRKRGNFFVEYVDIPVIKFVT